MIIPPYEETIAPVDESTPASGMVRLHKKKGDRL